MRAVDLLRRSDLLRSLVATSRRARLLDQPLRFSAREIGGSSALETYRLRSSGHAVSLRHRSPDVYALDQAFLERHFDLPEQVAASLSGNGGPHVLDLGANIGLFGIATLQRFPTARLVAFEPDPSNVEVLRRAIEANRLVDRWEVIDACADVHDHTVRFAVGGYGVSHVAEAGESGIEVNAVDVFPYLQAADLVKLDIEGAEWPILEDERFRQISARAVHAEYHTRWCPSPDPERYATELLEAAGFRVSTLRRHSPQEGILCGWK